MKHCMIAQIYIKAACQQLSAVMHITQMALAWVTPLSCAAQHEPPRFSRATSRLFNNAEDMLSRISVVKTCHGRTARAPTRSIAVFDAKNRLLITHDSVVAAAVVGAALLVQEPVVQSVQLRQQRLRVLQPAATVSQRRQNICISVSNNAKT